MSTYLVVGASRGIGFALTKTLAANAENTVIVTVRNESKLEPIKSLGYTNIKPIFIEMTATMSEFQEAFKSLPELAPNGIDVTFHSAGISYPEVFKPLDEQDTDIFKTLYDVNVIGALRTYICVSPVIRSQTNKFKYVIISSIGGQTTGMEWLTAGYGMSKAAVNHFAKQLSLWHPEDIVIPIHPGYVDTDMVAGVKGMAEFISPEESVSGMLKVVGGLKKEDSGKFWDYTGQELAF